LFLPLSPFPHVLLKPKSDATRTSSWWENREVVSCKLRPYWTSQPVLWQGRMVASRPMQNDGTRKGRSRSLCPYKYYPEISKKGGWISGRKKEIKRERQKRICLREKRGEETGTKIVET
jgi:ribosome modulation factor